MKVQIIKDHESGLKAGQVKDLSVIDARAIVAMGIAVFADDEVIKPAKGKRKKAE